MSSAFFTDRRGGVAAMAGLFFGVTAVAAGGALDYTHATNKRHTMQDAADAALLAAAAMRGVEDNERLDRARSIFLASPFCEEHSCVTPNVRMEGSAIVFDATSHVDTSLLQIVGMSQVEIGVTARAVPVTDKPLDVVMILDYSGSMNGSNKYQDMAAAATQFIDSVESQPGDSISVGVAPFSKYVLTPMEGRYLFDVAAGANLMGQTVVGCVLNREHPHSTNAIEPTTATEGSLWPVFSYVTGSDPSAGGYSADYAAQEPLDYHFTHNGTDLTVRYLNIFYPNHSGSTPTYVPSVDGNPAYVDGHGGLSMTWVGTAMVSVPFQNAHPWDPDQYSTSHGGYGSSESWTQGNDSGLPPSFNQDTLAEDLSGPCAEYATKKLWARPLSKNFTALKTAISEMRPIGLTNIALGLDLGWHMLTPAAPFTEANTEPGTQKVAILLTDGVQTVRAHGAGGTISVTSANANIAESCEAMKTEGVEIFTIAFGINDTYTRDLLKACATSEPHYYEPAAGGDLDAVFEDIFEKTVSGRVRLTG